MNGKELLLTAVRNGVTPRPAWVPFVGVHGGHLIKQPASSYLKSSRLLTEGLKKAHDLYRPDGLPVCFDLQLEAEILGCELLWATDSPPSVKTHPLEDGSLSDLPVFETDEGRMPVVLQAMENLKKDIGETTALYGLICGPFTLASHLMGSDIFLQMFDHPDYVKAVISYCAGVGIKSAEAYVEAGADVIAVVDPMTSQISREHFSEFCVPSLNQVFESVREKGRLSSLFVCGDATRNLETMCATRCDNISIDENIPLEKVRDISRVHRRSFGGNLRLTVSLLLGNEDDSRLDAIRCIDIGGGAGFVLAPGCDLPYSTPTENLQAAAEMVHDAYRREVCRRTIIARTADDQDDVELPNYAGDRRLFIDVVTLDSASCAPCQYMMAAVKRAGEKSKRDLVIREHRISTRQGLVVMRKLKVEKVPTICMDGEQAFISTIPDETTLLAEIDERSEAKSRACASATVEE